ncbi:LacI family transcriptional regulator [Kineococcus xinjiangensis]|uniref:LacI family transcriptional regulator n=1 Tax=Kineococcus xinjiangensis TaxID=512762 RepID=A0A2S6ISI4_9ACTN|nr:LacI family DNA-binding transcriptional regulator [Kineococcus xinjiangensis]PPK97212.1 LacI family transcriptional regulator [Kineococcus xinjiangensis]
MTTSRPVTLADVARQAGVSLATASRALNGSARVVRPDLAERVCAAAAELGYVPDPVAQSLARKSSNLVGLIVHDIADPFFSSIAAGAMRVADEMDMVLTLGATGRDPRREIALVTTMKLQRARALVLVGSRLTDDPEAEQRLATELEAFAANGGRVCSVRQPGLPGDVLQPDNRGGARELAAALAGLGHRHVAVIAGPEGVATSEDRLAGFREGLAAAGVDPGSIRVHRGRFDRDGGYAAGAELAADLSPTTCVFALSDVMAMGAVAALRERGVSVPDDVSVAGFDDIPTLRDTVPALSTVRIPLESIGERAARMALENPAPEEPRHVVIPAEVVLRASTAPPRAG